MKISVIAVGKLKEKFWRAAVDEYTKRLGGYTKIVEVEVPDIDPAKAGGVQAAKDKEATDILSKISPRAHVILLDINGKLISSEDLAEHIEKLTIGGTSEIVLVIGGSCGVADSVYERADAKMSFGRITLPHNLARVVAFEQVYRAFKIIRNEPYHK